MFNNLKLKIMNRKFKFDSDVIKENKMNIKVYSNYVCYNNKTYKENIYSLIDYIVKTNDRLQIRQLYNLLCSFDDKGYIFYFHQKQYIKRVFYIFFKDENTYRYFLKNQ